MAKISIVWAILAPLFLWYYNTRTALPRRWSALAVDARNAPYGQMLKATAEAQEQETSEFEVVVFVSSALIVVLSLFCLSSRSKQEIESTKESREVPSVTSGPPS